MVHFHEDANDVVQNTFIKVYRYLPDFKKQSALSTWIYRIATNESINHLNKKKKRMSISVDQLTEELGKELEADSYFNGDNGQILLIKAIEQLPPKQRAVFNMRYFEEMPYQELSEILETSVGSLKASYHHAVKKIETYLSE